MHFVWFPFFGVASFQEKYCSRSWNSCNLLCEILIAQVITYSCRFTPNRHLAAQRRVVCSQLVLEVILYAKQRDLHCDKTCLGQQWKEEKNCQPIRRQKSFWRLSLCCSNRGGSLLCFQRWTSFQIPHLGWNGLALPTIVSEGLTWRRLCLLHGGF